MMRKSTAWTMLAPSLVLLGVTGLLPFLYVLRVSFFDWNPLGVSDEMVFSWANNFRRLAFDEPFLRSIGRTLVFAVVVVTIELVLGFALALMLLQRMPGMPVFRVIHTLPLVVAPIVVGAAFKLLMVPGFGPVPHYLQQLFDIKFIYPRSGIQAFALIVLVDVWHWTPFVTLSLLAGLSALPREPVEQALVDGATGWQVLWQVTVPLLKPVIATILFLRLMDALRIVDEVWMITGGGPADATRFSGIYIWRKIFESRSYGYGSAMSVFLLYLTIVICWLLFVMIGERKGDES